jgi:tetratricopeptide (TPR) repeat protein
LYNKFVISTGAYAEFLLRGASNDLGCGSPKREPHKLRQRHQVKQEIRGERSGEICGFFSPALCLLAIIALFPAPTKAQNQLPPGTRSPDTATTSESQREAAETKIEQRDFEGARTLLKKQLAAQPGDARALFDLGYVEDAGSHDDAAAADYRKAIAADPKQFEARLALGLLLAHQDKYDEAREQMQQAVQLKPDPPNPTAQAEAFRTLAELDRTSDPPAARDALVAALRLSPETPADLLLTAQIAEANDDTELAQTAYKRLLAGHPAPSASVAQAATGGLAQLLIKQKKYADAEPLLKSALQRDPRDAALNAQLATTLVAEGKNDEALPVLEALRQLEPGNASVDQMLADAYAQAGHPEKAEPIYAKMALANPGNEELLAAQGENLLRQRLYRQAQQVLERAVKLKPDDGDAWSGLAFAASENKQYQVALQALSTRAKYLAETPITYFLWATCYDNLHQSKPAQEFYHKFLASADGKFPDQEWQAQHRLVTLGGSH